VSVGEHVSIGCENHARALICTLLRELGCTVLHHVPDRMMEGYGPNGPALHSLVVRGASLIVCVDCGTGAAEALGFIGGDADIVVLDMHRCFRLPSAIAAAAQRSPAHAVPRLLDLVCRYVLPVCPQVQACAAIDQARVDAQTSVAALHASLDGVPHAQFGGYRADIGGNRSVGHCRMARRDEQAGDVRECAGQLLGQTFRKKRTGGRQR
jgi:hypothetical protein